MPSHADGRSATQTRQRKEPANSSKDIQPFIAKDHSEHLSGVVTGQGVKTCQTALGTDDYVASAGKVLIRMTGFKNFIMRGNLIELAVAVVIGTQFSNLVKQFVSSFVNPLLSLVGGTPDLGKLVFKVGTATFTYGQFLTEALTFLISALVVYYAMVLPVGRLLKLLERNKAATTRDCPECTMSIPVAARRCPECTAEVAPVTEQPQPIG